ncbi:hypothetical protein PUN28_003189 [Cardiocondyla obscurior]|uniref:Uncharacterized protein n=1 Tax=Cardiocondyla obscurior TaxID=286306 RepID=A0AAW2GM78_9HYME
MIAEPLLKYLQNLCFKCKIETQTSIFRHFYSGIILQKKKKKIPDRKTLDPSSDPAVTYLPPPSCPFQQALGNCSYRGYSAYETATLELSWGAGWLEDCPVTRSGYVKIFESYPAVACK